MSGIANSRKWYKIPEHHLCLIDVRWHSAWAGVEWSTLQNTQLKNIPSASFFTVRLQKSFKIITCHTVSDDPNTILDEFFSKMCDNLEIKWHYMIKNPLTIDLWEFFFFICSTHVINKRDPGLCRKWAFINRNILQNELDLKIIFMPISMFHLRFILPLLHLELLHKFYIIRCNPPIGNIYMSIIL